MEHSPKIDFEQIKQAFKDNPGFWGELLTEMKPNIDGAFRAMGYSVRNAEQDELYVAQRIQEKLPDSIMEQLKAVVEGGTRQAREPEFKTWAALHAHMAERKLTPGSREHMAELTRLADENGLSGTVDRADIEAFTEKGKGAGHERYLFGAH